MDSSVKWLSNSRVEDFGFEKVSERTWVKDGNKITYDGTWWKLNDTVKIETVEDLIKNLSPDSKPLT